MAIKIEFESDGFNGKEEYMWFESLLPKLQKVANTISDSVEVVDLDELKETAGQNLYCWRLSTIAWGFTGTARKSLPKRLKEEFERLVQYYINEPGSRDKPQFIGACKLVASYDGLGGVAWIETRLGMYEQPRVPAMATLVDDTQAVPVEGLVGGNVPDPNPILPIPATDLGAQQVQEVPLRNERPGVLAMGGIEYRQLGGVNAPNRGGDAFTAREPVYADADIQLFVDETNL
jgi:hypothetical protein